MSFTNRDNFILCLTALAKASNTMLNKSGENEHSSLVPDLSRKVSNLSL